MTTEKTIGVRMPKRLVADLEEAASRESNSVSSLIRRLLSEGLSAGDRQPRGDPRAERALSV